GGGGRRPRPRRRPAGLEGGGRPCERRRDDDRGERQRAGREHPVQPQRSGGQRGGAPPRGVEQTRPGNGDRKGEPRAVPYRREPCEEEQRQRQALERREHATVTAEGDEHERSRDEEERGHDAEGGGAPFDDVLPQRRAEEHPPVVAGDLDAVRRDEHGRRRRGREGEPAQQAPPRDEESVAADERSAEYDGPVQVGPQDEERQHEPDARRRPSRVRREQAVDRNEDRDRERLRPQLEEPRGDAERRQREQRHASR